MCIDSLKILRFLSTWAAWNKALWHSIILIGLSGSLLYWLFIIPIFWIAFHPLYLSQPTRFFSPATQGATAYFPPCSKKHPVGSVGSSSLPKRHRYSVPRVTTCSARKRCFGGWGGWDLKKWGWSCRKLQNERRENHDGRSEYLNLRDTATFGVRWLPRNYLYKYTYLKILKPNSGQTRWPSRDVFFSKKTNNMFYFKRFFSFYSIDHLEKMSVFSGC